MTGEISILIFGSTGSGKSSLGNSILGKDEFDTGCSACSVTREVQTASAEKRFGYNVTVVDTPDYTNIPSTESVTAKCTAFKRPGAILLVTSVGDDPLFLQETIDILNTFLGEETSRSVVAVFTRASDLRFYEDIQSPEEYIECLPDSVRHGIRDWAFLDMAEAKFEGQLNQLMDKVVKICKNNDDDSFPRHPYALRPRPENKAELSPMSDPYAPRPRPENKAELSPMSDPYSLRPRPEMFSRVLANPYA